MTEQQLKKYTDKGYDQAHTNKHLSLIFLLNPLITTKENQLGFFKDFEDIEKKISEVLKG